MGNTWRGNSSREEKHAALIHPIKLSAKAPTDTTQIKATGTAGVESGFAQLPNTSKDRSSERFQ